MIIRLPIYIIALFVIFFALIGGVPALAQENNDSDVKTLGDILNDPIEDYGSDGKPLTSVIMANYYYKTCINKKSTSFNEEEKEILCGCNAARLSEIFTVDDFKNLWENSKKGKDTRGIMLANSYAPCMEYVMTSKTKRDCYKAPFLKKLKAGKKKVCTCTANKFNDYAQNNATYIVTDAMHYEPRTLNPLEHFFTTKNYAGLQHSYMRGCYYDVKFEMDNQ